MVEFQGRPFGKDHDIVSRQKALVRLSHQFAKNAFPPVPHHCIAQPAPHHDSDPGIPQTGTAGNHVKESRRNALSFPFDSLEVLCFFQEYRRAP